MINEDDTDYVSFAFDLKLSKQIYYVSNVLIAKNDTIQSALS